MMQSYKGYIDKITYHNQENGFTIARLVADDEQKKITVVGAIAALEEGEHIEVDGAWNEHPKYGRQFKIEEYRIIYPTTVKGIEKYLGSGLIRGIGPVSAKRIVDHFGKDALDVIDENPLRLTEVPKLGRKRVDIIEKSWGEACSLEEIESALSEYRPSIFAIVHAETSTGVCQPMEGIGDLCKKYDHIHLIAPEWYNITPFYQISDLLLTEASSTIYEMLALDKPVVVNRFFKLR